MAQMTAAQLITEGLNDYSDSLEDAILPGLVAALAAQQPAWMREAAREAANWDGWDWAYEDWKLEREWARDEAEFDEAMTRMDDDGGPVTADWWHVRWGLE